MRAQIPREIAGGWAVTAVLALGPLVAPSLVGWGLGWATALFWRSVGDW